MTQGQTTETTPAHVLCAALLQEHPGLAAQALADLPPESAAGLLDDQPASVLTRLWAHLSPAHSDAILPALSDKSTSALLSRLDPNQAAALLLRRPESEREHYLGLLDRGVAGELATLLAYPDESVGRIMDTRITVFRDTASADEVLATLKSMPADQRPDTIVLQYGAHHYCGMVEPGRLALADTDTPVHKLARTAGIYMSALDRQEEAIALFEQHRLEQIPVIDSDGRPVGLVKRGDVMASINQELSLDMQTMVGASPEERALSSSWFSVRKRLPWLQINLLTAFLASAVVGVFEATIAQYTALAILLPVAAGQSGNTGAQALAVTMRGLTLREITLRHWLRIMVKELGTGLINGAAVAVMCAAGVYVWSQSYGLALIIALAMIASMTLASAAGALVPLALKKLGQDPAQSSSIILTTITDIFGFLFFLGIATALSGLI
jgi:magnesium transporter